MIVDNTDLDFDAKVWNAGILHSADYNFFERIPLIVGAYWLLVPFDSRQALVKQHKILLRVELVGAVGIATQVDIEVTP